MFEQKLAKYVAKVCRLLRYCIQSVNVILNFNIYLKPYRLIWCVSLYWIWNFYINLRLLFRLSFKRNASDAAYTIYFERDTVNGKAYRVLEINPFAVPVGKKKIKSNQGTCCKGKSNAAKTLPLILALLFLFASIMTFIAASPPHPHLSLGPHICRLALSCWQSFQSTESFAKLTAELSNRQRGLSSAKCELRAANCELRPSNRALLVKGTYQKAVNSASCERWKNVF